MKPEQQYTLIKALRPFSLSVAVISCSLGILLAWKQGYQNPHLSLMILVGGVAAQAGINFINDLEDLNHLPVDDLTSTHLRGLIKRNAAAGMLCFMLAGIIAFYLIIMQGWMLFLVIMLSAILAVSYNFGPLNFKHRGLAIVQVFLLMGIVMVQGAYFSISGQFSFQVFLYSIPVSVLISLLLLSNELRDWETDQRVGAFTLTVRIGFFNARRLYWLLVLVCYTVVILYYFAGYLPQLYWLFLPVPLLIPIHRYLRPANAMLLTPLTGRFFLFFGITYLLALSNTSWLVIT